MYPVATSAAERVGSLVRRRNLPSSPGVGRHRRPVDPQQPRGRGAQEAAVGGLGAQVAGQLLAFGGGEVVRTRERFLELPDEALADGGVADRLGGVAADDEAVAHDPLVEDDLLDLEVAGDGVVAALARQGRLRLGALAAELLAGDVVAAGALEIAPVLGRVDRATHSGDELDITHLIGSCSYTLTPPTATRGAPRNGARRLRRPAARLQPNGSRHRG